MGQTLYLLKKNTLFESDPIDYGGD